MPGRRARELVRRRRRVRRASGTAGSGIAITVVLAIAFASTHDPDDSLSGDIDVEVAGITAAPTAVTTASVTTVGSTTMPPRRRFTIAVTGDILLHMPVTDRAARYALDRGTGVRDFRPMFDPLRPLLSDADLALCHLETPLSPDGQNLRGNPVFSSAPEIAPAIADAGFDGCSTASNHSYDTGDVGVRATLDHLDFAGVRHRGSARTEAERSTPTIYDLGGLRVAHLAYTSFLNGAHPNEPWMIDLVDAGRVSQVAADAATAREAGADFVVVSVHWGNEFVRAPSGPQIDLADALTAIAEVDIVVGHHAHVVQPIEQRNGKWVAFGLGNLLSNQHAGACCPVDSQDGVVVRFTVEVSNGSPTVVSIDFTPTWVDRETYAIVPVSVAAFDPALDASTRDEYLRSRERTAEAVRSNGAAAVETPADVVLSRPSTAG
jgi:poly-gamma-glutamate capsule biosynthesis protein CapA/YwtB (metallophosphatase superfamily)